MSPESERMPAKKLVIYVVVPAALTLPLIAAYFSGIDWLQQLVAPRFNRELGLLENLQNAFLLAIIVMTAYGIRRKPFRAEKAVMIILMLGTVFVLLEEIDYGKHYYDYMIGRPWYADTGFRNIHNMGDTTDVLKRFADIGMVLFFVVLPLAFAKSRNDLLRYITPDRFFILTMITMFAISKLAHFLADAGVGTTGPIRKNISEFRELLVYYVFMIYLLGLVFRRDYTSYKGRAEEGQHAGASQSA